MARLAPLSFLLALAGCSSSGAPPLTIGEGTWTAPAASVRPLVAPDPAQLLAADPLLPGFDGWPVAFTVYGGATCEIGIARGGSVLATLDATLAGGTCSATWDGRTDAGAPIEPGVVSAVLTVGGTTSTMELEIVRLGVERIDVVPGAGDERAPLLYRATDGERDGWFEILATDAPFRMAPDAGETGGVALEGPGRVVRPIPTPSDDVLSPALDPSDPGGVEDDTYLFPMAWVAGATPTLELAVTTDVAGGAPGAGDPVRTEVRLVAPAGTAIDGEDRMRDGNILTLSHASSPVPAVGRYDVTYDLHFEARAVGSDGDWRPIPGSFPVTLRYYGLVAMPAFGFTSIPHRAWVDVVDRITGWVGGASADPDAVASEIVRGIYEDLNLRYDTVSGASHYTDYPGTSYAGAVFSMQDFEERDNGRIINCSDAASILSSYGRMIGLELTYHILTRGTSGFDLNFIRAIGMPTFDETPFDSGRGGFRYHAIVGTPDGRTWDATLAVDGDGVPTSTPNTLLLVQGLDPNDYLVALSSEASSISTTYDDEVRIR